MVAVEAEVDAELALADASVALVVAMPAWVVAVAALADTLAADDAADVAEPAAAVALAAASSADATAIAPDAIAWSTASSPSDLPSYGGRLAIRCNGIVETFGTIAVVDKFLPFGAEILIRYDDSVEPNSFGHKARVVTPASFVVPVTV